MQNAQQEEFKHFAMDLATASAFAGRSVEFLLRRTPKWKAAMEKVLFTEGDIVELGERADEAPQDRPRRYRRRSRASTSPARPTR